YLGRPMVLVLSRGLGCSHCMSQLRAFEDKKAEFHKLGVEVVFVAPDTVPELITRLPATSFAVLSDPELAAFRKYCSYLDVPLHGVMVLDELGKTRWQVITPTAYMDVDTVLSKAAKVASRSQDRITLAVASLPALGADKEVTGDDPAQWKFLADSTATR